MNEKYRRHSIATFIFLLFLVWQRRIKRVRDVQQKKTVSVYLASEVLTKGNRQHHHRWNVVVFFPSSSLLLAVYLLNSFEESTILYAHKIMRCYHQFGLNECRDYHCASCFGKHLTILFQNRTLYFPHTHNIRYACSF